MVHRFDQINVQITDIARDQKGQDLPPPIGQQAVAESHSTGNDEGGAPRVALVENVGPRPEAFLIRTQPFEHAHVRR
jgi:hypothetical protein